MGNQSKSPTSGEAGRISKADEISFACFHILTYDLLGIHGDLLVNDLTCWLILTESIDPDFHLGRTNAPALLAGLVAAGELSEQNAEWLRQFALLLSKGSTPAIDPLIEAARRIVLVRFAAGGEVG